MGGPTKLSLVFLLAANAGVAVAVLLGQLRLGDVFLLYWLETAIIGVLSLVRLAIATRWAAFGLVPFFILHAGMFMSVHLIFLNVLFIGGDGFFPAIPLDRLAPTLLGLALSHTASLLLHRGEKTTNAGLLMGGFYGRVVVMHLTILFGGFAAAALGSPAWALVLLVGLKTAADAGSHLFKHKFLGRPEPTPAE